MTTIRESLVGQIAQKAIQMEHELLSRGIPENEVHRAVISYFSQPEPPPAMQWPGPVTGLDLGPTISPIKVVATPEPLTNFSGLPQDVQPYPTSNVSPYGIGSSSQPYQSFFTPDPNSIGNVSNTYDVLNPSTPPSDNWTGLASDVNSDPSMHGEYGYNVATTIPTFPRDYESLHDDSKIHSKIIEPSGSLSEATDSKKKKYLELLAKWTLLLGGAAGIDAIVKKYLDSDSDEPIKIVAEYEYHGHDNDDECSKFSGKRFNLVETHNRPVIPSEKLGYTTTHPNCKCTWKITQDSQKPLNKVTKDEQKEINKIENHITKAANKGELHKISKDGKLSKKTTNKNPLTELEGLEVRIPELHLNLPKQQRPISCNCFKKHNLQEAFSSLRSEFTWLTDDYIAKAKELADDADGTLYLIRAAGETITDHTGEGEPYRRKLSADELNSMARTAIGKSMDINHQPEFETDATILDVEFDKNRKEMQMLVVERDSQINDAIDDGKITAVSINGGMPRSEKVEQCNHNCDSNNCELCLVPQGVVLGELDGIGMTWVITDKNGLYWNGHFISSAEPGVKFTKIEKL